MGGGPPKTQNREKSETMLHWIFSPPLYLAVREILAALDCHRKDSHKKILY